MKEILENKFINMAIRVFLGFIFILYGIEKIADPIKFAGEIANYQMMPELSWNLIAITLPWIELVTGIFLIFGFKIKASSIISTGFLIIFTVAIGIAFARGLNINCGCSGTGELVGWPKILKNTGMIVLGLNLIFFGSKKQLG